MATKTEESRSHHKISLDRKIRVNIRSVVSKKVSEKIIYIYTYLEIEKINLKLKIIELRFFVHVFAVETSGSSFKQHQFSRV